MSILSLLRRREVVLETSEPLTPTVKLFRFRAEEDLGYEPGQIAALVLKVGDKRLTKPYSIASRPGDRSAFELCIKLVPDGRATPFLHTCEAGFTAKLIGPTGGLRTDKADTDRLVFVATGTGIAPFRSIITHLRASGDNRRVELIAGSRFDTEVLFVDEWHQLETDWDQFSYTPVVSRPSEAWSGATGHVQEHLGESLDDATFFLCGLPAMVDDTKELLRDAGVAKGRIKTETFH